MKTIKKNQIIKATLISMLLFFAIQLSAQESYFISGCVKSTQTESIKGADVLIINPVTFEVVAKGKCKESGNFYIDAVNPGEYNLVVKKNGIFRAKVKRIIIDGDGKYLVKNNNENDSIQPQNGFIAAK